MHVTIKFRGLEHTLKRVERLSIVLKTLNYSVKGFVDDTLKKIKDEVPKDSGDYSKNWNVNNPPKSAGNLAFITFSNDLVYARPLEYGVTPGEKPWPSVGPKTVQYEGKIYSSQAPGGTAEPVINKSLDEFSSLLEKIVTDIF